MGNKMIRKDLPIRRFFEMKWSMEFGIVNISKMITVLTDVERGWKRLFRWVWSRKRVLPEQTKKNRKGEGYVCTLQ